MTREDKKTIIAEIDRLYQVNLGFKKEYRFHPFKRIVVGRLQALEGLKSFISSLPTEKEPSCQTCTNDKGCVTCKDGELWEGKEQTSEDLEEENVGVYEKTCWKCGTKFLYVSEAIKHDRDGDYVVCPTCDALVVHLEIPKKEEKK